MCTTGVNDTGEHIFPEIFIEREYLREFLKKFGMTLFVLSGAWEGGGGEMNHKKNLKRKILWHRPFKERIKLSWKQA
jgi:hypothetical protein